MPKYILLYFSSVFCIFSCTPSHTQEAQMEKPKLDSLLTQFYEDFLKFSPLDATMIGDNRYDDLLPNTLTASYRAELKDLYTRYREQLTAYDRNTLSEADQMNYDILLWECDIALEGQKFKAYLTPVNQFSSMHLLIGQLASGSSIHPFTWVNPQVLASAFRGTHYREFDYKPVSPIPHEATASSRNDESSTSLRGIVGDEVGNMMTKQSPSYGVCTRIIEVPVRAHAVGRGLLRPHARGHRFSSQ
jgi:Bacterial protein of unknown function (DUF885)